MITSLDQLDFQKTYSYADYLSWQFDEFVELIKGKIMPMSAPTRVHQKISMNLSRIISNYLLQNNLHCEVYAAPFDVRLLKNPYETSEDRIGKTDKQIYTVVQPDLCVICDLEKLDDKGCKGSPDLIIEIVSDGNAKNAKHDIVDKFEIYAENGVPEYWIVRPTEQSIQKFVIDIDTNEYQFKGIFAINSTITSSVLPNLEIEINDVFRDRNKS